MITPLRKLSKDGALYKRTESVMAQLTELDVLSRDKLLTRCEITSTNDPDYVFTECLLYFVRASRADNGDLWFEKLYKLLSQRVLRRLPGGRNAPQINRDIGERAFDRFVELMAGDRQEYDDRLDYYEIHFASALASLRLDANKSAFRNKNRKEALVDLDAETNDLSAEVELAAVTFDPFAKGRLDNADYRFALEAAIDSLPPIQARILTMLSLGLPIHSNDTDADTISKSLGKSDKTIRTHRNKAFDALRKRLEPDAT